MTSKTAAAPPGPATNPCIRAASAPPVMEVRRRQKEIEPDSSIELLDLSQAVPADPPHEAIRNMMADCVLHDPSSHLYGEVLGIPELRDEIACRWSAAYRGCVRYENVAVTSGCNQAFTAAMTAVARAGDAAIIVSPWYFNHKMWLDMMGIEAAIVHCGPSLLPDPGDIQKALSPRVKAIILITPNNPAGTEYPAALLRDVSDIARRAGIALIVDETYRDFHSRPGPPHDLFRSPDWEESFIHLYSFSKSYRLTGHRVGALLASPKIISEVEKFLDAVAISTSQIGQRAALLGLRTLGGWLHGQRQVILGRSSEMRRGFSDVPDWRLYGCGAYFALAGHPFDMPSDRLAQRLLADIGVLALPGTVFGPLGGQGGNGDAEKWIRLAFANVTEEKIRDFFHRIKGYCP